MNITVFTSNQPRHLALLGQLSQIAEKVYAIQEVTTLFPGQITDRIKQTPIMEEYFQLVKIAEQNTFGQPTFLPDNVYQIALQMGDLGKLNSNIIKEALSVDYIIVFGSSFIKSPLIDILITKKAINIHIGISPYYRGSATNFWALYDNNPHYVGATIHLLDRGIDSGDILFHTFPITNFYDPFMLGMKAVYAAQKGLIEKIKDHSLYKNIPSKQKTTKLLRHSKNRDFSDDIAREYLKTLPSPEFIKSSLETRDVNDFINPLFY